MEIKSHPLYLQLDIDQKPEVKIESREIEFIACKEQKIIRYDWFKGEKYWLTFSHKPGSVDLSRVTNRQCMFLNGHTGFFSSPEIIGQVTEAKIENKELLTTHLIGGDKNAENYWLNAQRGVIPGVSIEANPTKIDLLKKAVYEEDENRYSGKRLVTPAELLVAEWELLCISSVPIPAIVGAKAKQKFAYDDSIVSTINLSYETGYEWLEESPEKQPKKQYFDLGEIKMSDIQSDKTDRVTELASEIRDLKLQLSDANKQLSELKELKDKGALETAYWKLRNTALLLYAVENKLTEEDFNLDFVEDPQVDLVQLFDMSSEGSKLHLLGIERDLNRAARRNPINRLKKEEDKELLSNRFIGSREGDTVERSSSSSSSSTLSDDNDVDNFFQSHQPRRVG